MKRKWLSHKAWILLAAAVLSAAAVHGDDAVPFTSAAEEGDLVTFGKYEQDPDDDGDSFRALEWRVLEKTDDGALLITDKVIAALPFESADERTETDDLKKTWEECSLRSWLNDVFPQIAFSAEEQDLIRTTEVSTPDNGDIDGGEDTEDKVFLLSGEEARKYFERKTDRQAQATVRAAEADEGLTVFRSELADDNVFWWLRSPGSKEECAQVVGAEGSVAEGGYLVSRLDIGVRPVIRAEMPEKEVSESGGNRDYGTPVVPEGTGVQDYPGAQGDLTDSVTETDGVLAPP